jgi:CRISPR-associated endonuclease/helicase Cas3
VGNREKFNDRGVVPVHYSETTKFIGEYEVELKKMYANSNGQRLDQHLLAVGYVASKIIERLIPDDENLVKSVYLAGLWHDVGKIDKSFQEWLQKKLKKRSVESDDDGVHMDNKSGSFSWQQYPRHNEISLLFFNLFFPQNQLNSDTYERVKHVIYWHHAKPLRKLEFANMVNAFEKLTDFEKEYGFYTATINALQSSITEMASEYFDAEEELIQVEFPKFHTIEDALDGVGLPMYKHYTGRDSLDKYNSYITKNAKNDVARSALITADRLVSSLSSEALNAAIINATLEELVDTAFHKERGLGSAIDDCLVGFVERYGESERNKHQAKAAKELADSEVEVGVLKGPAGCGKTKIALEWCKNTNVKKLYWVCPRVQICEGIFADLTADEYLPKSRIEIVTGEIKQIKQNGTVVETDDKELFSGDVVITTIDQIVNAIITHKNVTTLIDLMDAHVVFDEYHEYITMPAFNLLFAELVSIKKLQQNKAKLPNALLVSATPHPIYVRDLLQLNGGDIIGIESFNQSRYEIDFQSYDETLEDDSNPLFAPQPENSIIISNTAITAQKSFVHNQARENAILFHSKFLKSDKVDLFDKVFKTFKQKGTQEYDVLRSGPIVQASLNITCSNMVSEMTTAENFLQRLGRLDRFGERSETNRMTIAYTKDVKDGKSKGASSRFLNALHSLQSTKVWFDFLQNNLIEEVNINKMYALYEQFYKDKACVSKLEQDLVASLKESVVLLENRLLDPVTFPNKSNKDDSSAIKIKKNSLRGDSRFVQMAKCRVESREDYIIESEYAYSELIPEEAMTYEVETIKGYDQSDKNLLAFMVKKHHNIKGGNKTYKDGQLLNEARDPSSPIYLSYTPEDLKKVESNPHPYAIYYMIGTKQPIGAMSLNYLLKEKHED